MNKIFLLTFSLFVFLFGQMACQFASKEKEKTTNSTFHSLSADTIPPGTYYPTQGIAVDMSQVEPPQVIPLKGQPDSVILPNLVFPVDSPIIRLISGPTIELEIQSTHLTPYPTDSIQVPALEPRRVPALPPVIRGTPTQHIRNLDVDQGFISSYPLCGMEDQKGNLWFGSFDGLCRYDGQAFYHYGLETGLPHDNIFKLIEDQRGYIWILAGKRQLVRYDGKTFTTFVSTDSEIVFNNLIEDIRHPGHLFLSTFKNGLLYFDGNQFTRLLSMDSLSGLRVFEMAFHPDSTLWMSSSKGLLKYDGKHVKVFSALSGVPDQLPHQLEIDPRGRVWVSFNKSGLGYLEGQYFFYYAVIPGTQSSVVTDMVLDSQQNVWITTRKQELVNFDGQQCRIIIENEGVKNSPRLRFVLIDRQGLIWTGHSGKGIYKLTPRSFFHYYLQGSSEKYFVMGICSDSANRIWMAQPDQGLSCIDGNILTNYNKGHGLAGNTFRAALADQKHRIWLTSSMGIFQFDGHAFIRYTKRNGLAGNTPSTLLEDRKGNIWIGYYNDGVSRFDGQNFIHFNDQCGLIDNGVNCLLEDGLGNIWIGTIDGLNRFDGEGITQFTEEDGLGFSNVSCLLEDGKGNIWIGTKGGGLYQFDGCKFLHFSTKNGLSNDKVITLDEDADGRIWVSTQKGITLLTPASIERQGLTENQAAYHLTKFGKTEGLVRMDYELNGSVIDLQNRIWWGSYNGLTGLDLNEFEISEHIPPLQLNTIEINDHFIDFDQLAESRLTPDIPFREKLLASFDTIPIRQNYPAHLSLPHDLNHLRFRFSAIDWEAPEQVQYSFRMIGQNDEWSSLSTEGNADFRGLAYGDYTFQVRAKGRSQAWSPPLEYRFTIHPPWYLSTAAKVFYVLLILYLLYLIRNLELRKQKKKLANQKRINEATARFVPTAFLDALGKKDIMEVKLGDAVEQNTTVLFTDIRDFTLLSEKMTPEENFRFVNQINHRLGPIITDHRGFVNQYLGDAIMALFQHSPTDALQAAIKIQHSIQQFNLERGKQNLSAIRIGIGLHTGPLIMGIIGDEKRMDAATISDTVNTASRIENLTKYFNARILLSAESLEEIRQEANFKHPITNEADFFVRFLGRVLLKGKREPIEIYECLDGEPGNIREKKISQIVTFQQGIRSYLNREFTTAIIAFEDILKINPGDKAAQIYLKKAQQLLKDGVSLDWEGVEVMHFK